MARKKEKTKEELLAEIAELRLRLDEAEETLRAIRQGEVDALVVSGPHGDQVYALQGVEHTYRVLVESMNEGAITLTEGGDIIYCNRAFAEMTGIPCGKMVGISSRDLVSEKDSERFGILWEDTLKGSGTGEIDLKLNSGRLPVYLSCSTRVQDEVLTVFAVATDISERKRAEDERRKAHDELEDRVAERTADLEESNKELEAFSYSVSHDLRAPLRHISGFVEILLKRLKDHPDEKTRKYANAISEASKKMGILIDNLLNFSRLGRSEMQKRKVNLNTLVKGVVQEIGEEIKERKIRWEIDELPDVLGDQALLRLVMVNLISNAVKFTRTRPQAEIKIGCKDDKNRLTCSVRDNGVGFDMKYADKLFRVFQRLHTQNEFEGTGIGLANVHRIISRHGGRVWAEGVVGQGAEFYFTLPKHKGA